MSALACSQQLTVRAFPPVPVGAKVIVVFKASVEQSVSLALSHGLEFTFVVVPQTDVFHCSSPHRGSVEPATAMTRLFTCFRRILVPEPGRKEARAPRPPYRRRWHPCAPTPAPLPGLRIPASRNRPCAPWSRCTVRR